MSDASLEWMEGMVAHAWVDVNAGCRRYRLSYRPQKDKAAL